MTFDKRIIGALRECKNKEQIAVVFIHFGITDIQEKQRYLTYAMYSPSYFFSPSTPPTDEQLYEFTLCHFINGYWRLTPFYEKLGLVKKPLSEADNRILKGTSKNPNFKLLFLGKSVFWEVFAYFYLLYFLF